MIIAEFYVAGLVRAQPRAQQGRGGNTIMAPAADEIHKWREGVRYAGQRAMAGRTPFLDAMRVDTLFLMPRPKKYQDEKWEPNTMELPCPTTPDCDNMIKAVWDALRMVAWSDDRLVARGEFYKRYVCGPEAPGVYVLIRSLERKPWTSALWERIQKLA